MMRFLAVLVLGLAFAVPANAKSGYEFGGCPYYYLDGTRVVQVCDERNPSNARYFWDWISRNIAGGGPAE